MQMIVSFLASYHTVGITNMDRPHPHLPSQQDFASAIDTTFGVSHAEGGAIEFTLIECKSLLSNERQECYSLIFRGPVDVPAVQSIYALNNEKLGTMDLFLVPVKKDDNGLYFEAVMNHLLPN